MRGTPYYYNGDELGMVNIRFDNIEDYNDVDTRNMYENLKNHGGDLKAFIEDKKQTSRDNCRTPFQWDNTTNGGFTTGKPWLKVNSNYITLNAAVQESDPNSCLNYFKKLVALRKKSPALIYGAYKLLDADNPSVYCYTRTLNEEKYFVLLNFSNDEMDYTLPDEVKNFTTNVLSDYPSVVINAAVKTIHLQPWQSVILK